MEMIADMANSLWLERLNRARLDDPARRFLAGGELFEDACQITLAGIRAQHKEWSEHAVMKELTRRLKLAENLEQSQ